MTEKERKELIFVGNWKMHMTIQQTQVFIRELIPLIADRHNPTYIAVPFTAIHAAAKEASHSGIVIGAQNMSDKKEGAFTGEISCVMLKDAGAKFVILGHSERRSIFGEGNRIINHKVKQALAENLQPILCIGETAPERQTGITEQVLNDQMTHCLEGIEDVKLERLIIAYEPVWAIGTGKTATPAQVQEMHLFCRRRLKELRNAKLADRIPILYGGSVNAGNIRALIEQPDIDGALIGGASLNVETFAKIINYQTIKV